MSGVKVACPKCGRSQRVRKDGRVSKHTSFIAHWRDGRAFYDTFACSGSGQLAPICPWCQDGRHGMCRGSFEAATSGATACECQDPSHKEAAQ